LATVGLVLLLSRRMRPVWERTTPPIQRFIFVLGFVALLAGATEAVSPALSHVSEDRALNEIAGNGYYTFWLALLGSDAPYEGLYATRPQPAVLQRLPGLLAEPAAEPGSLAPDSTLRPIRQP